VRAVADNGTLSWSPDGTQIAFSGGHQRPAEIFVVNEDGSGVRQLTDPAEEGSPRTPTRSGHCACAVWSPTATQIAYEAAQGGGKPDVYVMNADGSGRTRLTRNPSRDENPDWSPDGTQVAFYSERAGQAEIYIMNADGSKQVRVTRDPWYDSAVRWKPTP
jgi:Tol biopolymer transport system component